MPEDQKGPYKRNLVLRGTDLDRRASVDIEDGEIHVTLDQFRIWIGKFNLLSGHPHHAAADEAARLNLKNTASRGCWPGDTCKQTDNGKLYQCISGEGTTTGDWLDITDHTHLLAQITDAGTAAAKDVPASGDAAADEVVLGNDSRLTDARPPQTHTHDDRYYTEGELNVFFAGKSDVGHTHVLANISDAGTAAGVNIPVSGDAATDEAVLGNDSRLTDARTPQAHTHDDSYYTESEIDTFLAGKSNTSHTHVLANISDAGTAAGLNVAFSGDAAAGEVVKGNDSRLSDPRTPTAHNQTLSTITDAGTAAALDVPASGDAASNQAVKGNDSRLTDARTPTAHTQTLSTITDAGTAAAKNVPASGDAASDEVVLGNDSRLGSSVGVVPIGGMIYYDTGITGASYPSGVYARCEGGSYPDLRNKFIRGSATAGTTGGSDTHDHQIQHTTYHVSPCAGGGEDVDKIDDSNTSTEDNLPAYRTEIVLVRYA